MKIVTHYCPKPVPYRCFDWCAVTEDYDAELDGDRYVSRDPVGRGATEQDAIEDLKEQMSIRNEP